MHVRCIAFARERGIALELRRDLLLLIRHVREVERVRELTETHAVHERWFFEYDGDVYGAARLSDIDDLEQGWRSSLVCFDRTGWVALEHVLDR